MSNQFKKDDLRAVASKCKDGSWVATAYIETPEKILVFAVANGKKSKSTIKTALERAIGRLTVDEDFIPSAEMMKKLGWSDETLQAKS